MVLLNCLQSYKNKSEPQKDYPFFLFRPPGSSPAPIREGLKAYDGLPPSFTSALGSEDDATHVDQVVFIFNNFVNKNTKTLNVALYRVWKVLLRKAIAIINARNF